MQRDLNPTVRKIYVGPAALGPSKALIEALTRFHPSLRSRLRRFAVVAKPCADLLISFPAAAAMIAEAITIGDAPAPGPPLLLERVD